MSKFCDLDKNIKHIGEVSTSRVDGSPSGAKILTSTNGVTGDVRDTLDGKLAKMDQQFQDRFNTLAPIPWTPNTEIKENQSLQVFEHDGLFYLPNVKNLPFTTGSTFNADNWVLSELVTRDDVKEIVAKPTVYDVIVVYGQSNAVGFAGQVGVPAVDDDATPTPLPFCLYYNPKSDKIEIMSNTMIHTNWQYEGGGSRGNAWTSFSNEYYKRTGRGCIMLNAAMGGASIAQLERGFNPAGGREDYFGRMIEGYKNTLIAANRDGLNVGNKYCVFHQGETDQNLRTDPTIYSAALKVIAEDIFALTDISKFGIYIVGCPAYSAQPDWQTIQTAQMMLGRSVNQYKNIKNISVISEVCPSFSLESGTYNSVDLTHYSQRGYNLMGESGADGLVDWINATTSLAQVDSKQSDRVISTGRGITQMITGIAASNLGNFELLTRDSSGIGVGVDPCFIKSIKVQDGSLIFNASSIIKSNYNYSCSVNSFANDLGLSATIEALESGFYVRFYANVEFVVDVTNGAILTNTPNTMINHNKIVMANALFKMSDVSANACTVNHPAIDYIPQSTGYASAEDGLTNSSVRLLSSTETRLVAHGATTSASIYYRHVPVPAEIVAAASGVVVRLYGVCAPN